MGAVAEPDHPLRPPTDEIAIGLGELARVSVGAGEEEADPLTRNQPVAVELELLGHRAALELGGGVQPERLVKGLELQPRIGSDQAALDRVTVQADEGGHEDLGERVGGGDEEVHQGADDPRLGHDRTVDRRRQEDPGQRRRRPRPRPRLLQMLGDVGDQLGPGLGRPFGLALLAGSPVEELIHPPNEHRAVALGEATEPARRAHGQGSGVVPHGVEPVGGIDRLEERPSTAPRLLFEALHPTGPEARVGEQLAYARVRGGSIWLGMSGSAGAPRRSWEGEIPCATESAALQGLPHIVEPGQEPHVVLLEEDGGGLCSQSVVDRMGIVEHLIEIGVELEQPGALLRGEKTDVHGKTAGADDPAGRMYPPGVGPINRGVSLPRQRCSGASRSALGGIIARATARVSEPRGRGHLAGRGVDGRHDLTATPARRHGRRVAAVQSGNIDAVMASLVDEPVFDFFPLGLRLSGQDDVRRYYGHFLTEVITRSQGTLVATFVGERGRLRVRHRRGHLRRGSRDVSDPGRPAGGR